MQSSTPSLHCISHFFVFLSVFLTKLPSLQNMDTTSNYNKPNNYHRQCMPCIKNTLCRQKNRDIKRAMVTTRTSLQDFREGSHVANRGVRTTNCLTQQVVQKHVDIAPCFAHHEHQHMELGDGGLGMQIRSEFNLNSPNLLRICSQRKFAANSAWIS